MTRRGFLAGIGLSPLLGTRPGTIIVLNEPSGTPLFIEHPDVAAQTLARPGSTVKPFTLAAALANGPLGSFPCPGRLQILDRQMDCSHTPAGRPLTVSDAIAYSCNNFVAHAALKLTSQELAESFQRAGLATRTGLLRNEATGQIVPTSTTPARQLQALGEDSLLVTPLALASAYRKLAREAPDEIRDGLRGAVEFGTAQRANVPGLAVAGKTGTAMSPDRSHRQAWFAGFAPVSKPEVVIVVFLPQGSGGGDAAPLARTVLEAWRRSR